MGTMMRNYTHYNANLCYLSGSRPTVISSSWTAAMGEVAEDPRPSSPPLAAQSDSEGSNSSLELGSGVANIALTTTADVSGGITCRWQNCGLWFNHLDMLASHVTRVHSTSGHGGLFYCGWEGCTRGDKGFNARYKMLVHVRTHTNEKPHRCFKCDKSFSRAENLKIHARSHTGERPYVCPVPGCGKAYSNSSDRFKHTRTHAVDKPYCCKVPGCPKRYTDPSSLRKHVKTYRHEEQVDNSVASENSTKQNDKARTNISVCNEEERELTVDVVTVDSMDNGNLIDYCKHEEKSKIHNTEEKMDTNEDCFYNNTHPLRDSSLNCPHSCFSHFQENSNSALYGQDMHYSMLQSWFYSAEVMAFPTWRFPIWSHPLMHQPRNVLASYDYGSPCFDKNVKRAHADRLSFSSQDSNDDTMEDQVLPLDLTVHSVS